MKVYVVLEEDRGLGPTVAAVFSSLEAAKEFVRDTSHCFLSSEEGEEVRLKYDRYDF